MKIVVTGGGTGGHIFPALAVASMLYDQGHQIVYIGKPDSMESELVPQKGFQFEGVMFSGMPRKPGLGLLLWFAQLYTAKRAALKLLKEIKPDVVFGTGGYVTGPVLMAAQTLKIPYAIHEPDAHPGMVNRLMASHANVVTAAFAESKPAFKLSKKTLFEATGNPIRQDLGSMSKEEAITALNIGWNADKTTILIFGGSQGARSMNQATIDALPILLNTLSLQVIHITGQKLHQETLKSLKALSPDLANNPNYHLLPFSHDMPTLMAASDLAVCRAGSLTLSETYLAGLPTLLIPYPFAAADHQSKNAQASAKAGASVVLEDKELSGQKLAQSIQALTHSKNTLFGMTQAARSLAKPHATTGIVAHLLSLGARKARH